MAKKPQMRFAAPIPGQGMTAEPGSRPWQQPPRFTTVEEALSHYIPRFVGPDSSERMLDVLEMGVPVSTFVDGVTTLGIMDGLHTIDVAMLITPALMEMAALVADEAGIEYKMGTEEEVDSDYIDPAKIRLAIKKAKKAKKDNPEEDTGDMSLEEFVMEDEANMVPPKSGLMARKA